MRTIPPPNPIDAIIPDKNEIIPIVMYSIIHLKNNLIPAIIIIIAKIFFKSLPEIFAKNFEPIIAPTSPKGTYFKASKRLKSAFCK